MAIARKGVKPTKSVEDDIEVDDEEETGVNEFEDTETEDTDADDVEETEEDDTEEETEEEEYAGLPDVVEPIGAPNEGFDYFATVHADLKAAGYVANQGETKALLKYLNQMAFFNAFENGRHDIQGIGTIYSEIKPETERKATFDMANGVKKGETYTSPAKHALGFTVGGAAKSKLAEISELEGWSPEEVQALIDEATEDEE